MGVVYYANYLVWFEIARTDLLRDAGWSYRDMETEGFFLPVIEAGCQYHQAAKYDDELDIVAGGTLLSPARLRFEYTLTRLLDHVLLATGFTVHASLDRSGRPCRLPERVREIFERPQESGT